MLKFIRETTVPGSIILTDGDAAVLDLAKVGRKHGSVNHKKRQFLIFSDLQGSLDKPIEVTTNRVEGKHGFMRRTLCIRNGISRHHLDRYLVEAMWRMNHLHNRMESRGYDGDERRNFSLMRDVLAGAAGRKITLRDLRGEPQKRFDQGLKRNRTAPPAISHEKPEQRPLLPSKMDAVGSNPAPSSPLEEREQVLAT